MKAFAGKTQYYQEGMDLRDYFAAAALKGIFSGPEFETGAYDNYPDWQKGMAELAYGFADAMMEAREQK